MHLSELNTFKRRSWYVSMRCRPLKLIIFGPAGVYYLLLPNLSLTPLASTMFMSSESIMSSWSCLNLLAEGLTSSHLLKPGSADHQVMHISFKHFQLYSHIPHSHDFGILWIAFISLSSFIVTCLYPWGYLQVFFFLVFIRDAVYAVHTSFFFRFSLSYYFLPL